MYPHAIRHAAILAAICSATPAPAQTTYTWVGSSGTTWSGSANWTPSGVPDAAGEAAVFDSSTTHNCSLNSTVSPDSVTFAAGYPGTLNIATIPPGLLATGNLSLTSGTLTTTLLDRIRVTGTLTVDGGSITDISCAGAATIDGGTITSLRMNGSGSTLTSSGIVPVVLGTLLIPSGHTTQTRNFLPGLMSLSSPATYEVGSLSTLTLALHSLLGTVKLDSGSVLTFTLGGTVQGTLDASTSGSLVLCNGNWSCPGTYLRSGNTTNGLVINQSTGGTINHGANMADLVTIRGAAGMTSDWTSTNTIGSLSVLTSTTLRLTSGARLDVEGGIANLGTIDISQGGILGHPGQVTFVSSLGVPITTFQLGDPLHVRLNDGSNNLLGGVAESVTGLTLQNLSTGDTVSPGATESGMTTGLFDTGSIPSASGPAASDSTIQASSGDVIRVTYQDPHDPLDTGAFADITATTAAGVEDWIVR